MDEPVKKETPGIFRSTMVLFIITAVSALALAFVYTATREKVLQTEQNKKVSAYSKIFPDYTFGEEQAADGQIYIEAFDKEKKPAGYILFAESKGYSSILKIVYGIGLDGTIKGITVIYQKETPGLGARCEEVKKDTTLIGLFKNFINKTAGKKNQPAMPWFQKQYEGLTLDDLWLRSQKNGGKIVSMTGATVTSNAITKGVRESLEKFIKTRSVKKP
jgi:Na+-translocating ferredoxin:NAD+ oxidoreductase subunit G